MKKEELYKIAKRIMREVNLENKSGDCNNCFVYKFNKQLDKEHIELNFRDHYGSVCSKPLFYLEDLGIIKILSGVPSRGDGVDCDQLKIKILSNHDGNKNGNKI